MEVRFIGKGHLKGYTGKILGIKVPKDKDWKSIIDDDSTVATVRSINQAQNTDLEIPLKRLLDTW